MRISQPPYVYKDWTNLFTPLKLRDEQRNKLYELLEFYNKNRQNCPQFYVHHKLHSVLENTQRKIYNEKFPGEAEWIEFINEHIKDSNLLQFSYQEYIKLEKVLDSKTVTELQVSSADRDFIHAIYKELNRLKMKTKAAKLRKTYKRHFPITKLNRDKVGVYNGNLTFTTRAIPRDALEDALNKYIIFTCKQYLQQLPNRVIGKGCLSVYTEKSSYPLSFAYNPDIANKFITLTSFEFNAATSGVIHEEQRRRQKFIIALESRLRCIAPLSKNSNIKFKYRQFYLNKTNENQTDDDAASEPLKIAAIDSIEVNKLTIHTLCRYADALSRHYYKEAGLSVNAQITEELENTAEDPHSPLDDLIAAAQEEECDNGQSENTSTASPSPASESMKPPAYPGLFVDLSNASMTLHRLQKTQRKRHHSQAQLVHTKRQKVEQICQYKLDISTLRTSLGTVANAIPQTDIPEISDKKRPELKQLANLLQAEKSKLLLVKIKLLIKETALVKEEINNYQQSLGIQPPESPSNTMPPLSDSESNDIAILIKTHDKWVEIYDNSAKTLKDLQLQTEEQIQRELELYQEYRTELGSDYVTDDEEDHSHSPTP